MDQNGCFNDVLSLVVNLKFLQGGNFFLLLCLLPNLQILRCVADRDSSSLSRYNGSAVFSSEVVISMMFDQFELVLSHHWLVGWFEHILEIWLVN